MSISRTREQRVLAKAADLLDSAVAEGPWTQRFDVLEAAASNYGGWSLGDYCSAFPAERMPLSVSLFWGEKLHDVLLGTEVAFPLAIAALGHPAMAAGTQRKAGAYYTDFRLAEYLARSFPADELGSGFVIDPACGSGILLAALTMHVAKSGVRTPEDFIGRQVVGADLNTHALRATRATLGALCKSVDPIISLDERLCAGDSLARGIDEWERIAPGGFDFVIGNPPWEKLKVSRHEYQLHSGIDRHYGADYFDFDIPGLDDARRRMIAYVDELARSSALQGSGEADLYKLFLELSFRLVRPGGRVGLLVPAGLIRSHGTKDLRQFLVDHAPHLSLSLLHNRAAFFAIDSRMKFLALQASVHADQRRQPIVLTHAEGNDVGIRQTSSVRIGRTQLRELRPDLTLPEVANKRELDLFTRLVKVGTTLASPEWHHAYSREVDMTNDKSAFRRKSSEVTLPVIEGRSVHQFRSLAKGYRSGTGRAAIWEPLHPGRARLEPQFWCDKAALAPSVLERVKRPRAGFCDVTGQTNERSLLAAIIPSGAVCGNKVPTLSFNVNGQSPVDTALLWCAVANTFAVDWAARRVITTSMNYFVIRTLPLPRITPNVRLRLLRVAKRIQRLEGSSSWDWWKVAKLRAEIDVLVALSFGLEVADMEMVMMDFPLLDRGQPALPGESKSTITRDFLLGSFGDAQRSLWQDRIQAAKRLGAAPYVPADYAHMVSNGEV